MDIILGFALLKMADSTYVSLEDESSLSWYEMTQCQDTQSPQQTPPVPDPKLNPNGQFQGNGRGRGGGLRGGRGRGNGRKNFMFPNKGKSTKCTLCEGNHNTLMACKELPKYLPCGGNQKTLPPSLCSICLGTEFPSAKKSCTHTCNKVFKKTVCPASNKHFLLCECQKHMPALEYLKDNHDPKMGWKNFILMRGAFGNEAYKSMCAAESVSVSLSDSTVPKVDKGVQVDLDHKEAIGEEAERSHQIRRLTLDEAICFIMVGLMHMASEINHIPG